MTRPLVIIEAPYAQNPQAMALYLRACIQDCLLRGESPIASVATFCLTGALDDLKPEERTEGIAAGLAWYRVAEKAVAYTDHGISAGMMLGMAAAQNAGVVVEVRELYQTKKDSQP